MSLPTFELQQLPNRALERPFEKPQCSCSVSTVRSKIRSERMPLTERKCKLEFYARRLSPPDPHPPSSPTRRRRAYMTTSRSNAKFFNATSIYCICGRLISVKATTAGNVSAVPPAHDRLQANAASFCPWPARNFLSVQEVQHLHGARSQFILITAVATITTGPNEPERLILPGCLTGYPIRQPR